ncbi:MAG: hypothetical protein CMJ39_04535 [Phycisphaerae bacterium]|nr:hypothetical protein [Phycisphaerae bacterium]
MVRIYPYIRIDEYIQTSALGQLFLGFWGPLRQMTLGSGQARKLLPSLLLLPGSLHFAERIGIVTNQHSLI